MWLLRFHLIETRDYNRVERFCRDIGFETKRYSSMILVKGILLHHLQRKSWRQCASELGIPHIPIYHLSLLIEGHPLFFELESYFIERRIILFLGDEKLVTTEYLSSESVIERSRRELEILRGS